MQAKHDSDLALPAPALAPAQEAPVCYICREEDRANLVVQVCGCVGETGFAHVACAVSWLEARGGEPTSECAFCHRQYGLRVAERVIDYRTLACRAAFYVLLACNMRAFGHFRAALSLNALVHVYQCSSKIRHLFRLTVGNGKQNRIEAMMRPLQAYTWTVYQRAATYLFCAFLKLIAPVFLEYLFAWFSDDLQKELTWAFYAFYMGVLCFNTGVLPCCCFSLFIAYSAVMDAHDDFPWIRKHVLRCSDGAVYTVPNGGVVPQT